MPTFTGLPEIDRLLDPPPKPVTASATDEGGEP